MLTRVRFKNFRSHADTTIALGPINLLVGPAGAGKSNVFKALVLLQNSIHRSLEELFPPGIGEFHWVRSRWAGETDPITFEAEIDEVEGFPGSFRYELSIADSPAGRYVLAETLQRKTGEEEGWQWVFQRRAQRKFMGEFGSVDPYEPSILHKVRRSAGIDPNATNVQMAKAVAGALSRVGYYHLEVSELKSLGSGQSTDRIDYYGGRLPDFLAGLRSMPEHAATYESIRSGLGELLPGLDSILITQVGPDRQGLALSFKGHKGHITALDLSDGTMLTLGLLAIFHGPRKPGLLCVEEPETGLHPRRLRWLFDRMIGLAYPAEGQPRTQIILTTHSPDLCDLFSDMPEAVHVVDYGDRHISRVTPLPEILEKLKHSNKIESIGQAWATGLYENL